MGLVSVYFKEKKGGMGVRSFVVSFADLLNIKFVLFSIRIRIRILFY